MTWHAEIKNETAGPLSPATLIEMGLTAGDRVWQKGDKKSLPAGECEAFASYFTDSQLSAKGADQATPSGNAVETDEAASFAMSDAVRHGASRAVATARTAAVRHGVSRAVATARRAAFGSESVHNKVFRANMTGGIMGYLGDSSRRALRNAVKEANDAGYEVTFIIPDTVNLLQKLLYAVILLCTFLLWCPEPGYLLLGRKIDGAEGA